MNPRSPVVLLAFLTLIATAATPFIQPRYLYGVYVLFCIEIARTPKPATGSGTLCFTRPGFARRVSESAPAFAAKS